VIITVTSRGAFLYKNPVTFGGIYDNFHVNILVGFWFGNREKPGGDHVKATRKDARERHQVARRGVLVRSRGVLVGM
jgi:hypothetical protein